jgi:hypothetical protein
MTWAKTQREKFNVIKPSLEMTANSTIASISNLSNSLVNVAINAAGILRVSGLHHAAQGAQD